MRDSFLSLILTAAFASAATLGRHDSGIGGMEAAIDTAGHVHAASLNESTEKQTPENSDCVWDAWNDWSVCQFTCGGGQAIRVRKVKKMATGNGLACDNNVKEIRECHKNACPVDCHWDDWETWGACSVTCGPGTRRKSRGKKQDQQFGGAACEGNSTLEGSCMDQECPVDCKWSDWGSWEGCSKSCGTGQRSRYRSVAQVKNSAGADCPAPDSQTESCGMVNCPVDCVLEDWTAWDTCDVSCGQGNTQRTRKVKTTPIYGGRDCDARLEKKSCNQGLCPVNCQLSDWTEWGACSHTCVSNGTNGTTGTAKRIRIVVQKNNGRGAECGNLEETTACNPQKCPIDCTISDWTAWSDCSTSCGAGFVERTRAVETEAGYGGKTCIDHDLTYERRLCTKDTCPVDCAWSDWQDWRSCSVTCGSGSSLRMRLVKTPVMHGGKQCAGEPQQSRECNEMFCPQHCKWSAWTALEDCSTSCGQGSHRLTRSFAVTAQYGGSACSGNSSKVTECNLRECPIHCVWKDWSEWGSCTTSCDKGVRSRAREVDIPAQHGGLDCGINGTKDTEVASCPNLPACPLDCTWDDWTDWQGSCSVSCGSGFLRRSRTRKHYEQDGGHPCYGTEDDEQVCTEDPCPVNCELSDWGDWLECSATCGISGQHIRQRSVTREHAHGGLPCIDGQKKDFKDCSLSPCPVHCEWADWTDWSVCTRTCNGGQSSRHRVERINALHGGRPCVGTTTEEQICNADGCPKHCKWSDWTEWSCCDKTCGGGEKLATRSVLVKAEWGGDLCDGSPERKDACNSMGCPQDCVWASWTAWSLCTALCDGGEMSRTRNRLQPSLNGGKLCEGDTSESCSCNMQACPKDCKWSQWSEWTTCSMSCGPGGRINRTRVVAEKRLNGGDACLGAALEEAECNNMECPIDCVWQEWSEWTSCSVSCNGGITKKVRDHNSSARNGGRPCLGNNTESKACGTQLCPIDCTYGEWDQWSDCSSTCGVGQRFRTRVRHAEEYGGSPCVKTMEDIEDCRNEENSAACPNTTLTTFPLLRKELSVNSTRSALPSSIKDVVNITGGTSAPANDPISTLTKEISPTKFDQNTVAAIAGVLGLNVGVEAEAVVGRESMPSAMRRAFSILANCEEEAVSVELTKLTDAAPEGDKANVKIVYSISIKEGDRNDGNATKVADIISQQDMNKVDQIFNRSVQGFGLATFKVVSLTVTLLPVREDGMLDVQDAQGKIAAGLLAQNSESAHRVLSSSISEHIQSSVQPGLPMKSKAASSCLTLALPVAAATAVMSHF
eukprot:TRINITY_DN24452_c0_g3_i1.p1 TRINITY_DN24452_c0_g3~~TRINITY_DN24452_c0_g3_i1.p1  ORF type:complete len:1286 (-),score=145.81 TRINITY_DN24452_c0_g3_i1:109-3966(-)